MNGYGALLKFRGFHAFLWTQFLGAFNDNLCKIVISMAAIDAAMGAAGSAGRYLALVGAVFVLPSLFFSGYAGFMADRFSKRNILIGTKLLELGITLFGFFAFSTGKIEWMLVILFLLAVQSTLFSPAKYGILPEMLPDKDLSRANALLALSTFLAILMGTSLGGFIYSEWKGHLHLISLFLIFVSIVGLLTSFGIPKLPAIKTQACFQINPWGEISDGIKRLYPNKTLWLTVIGISYFWFLGALLQMDILLLGKEVLSLNDVEVGLLGAFIAIGIGAGSLAAGRLSGNKVELGLVPIGSIGMGIFSVCLSFVTTFGEAAMVLSLLGFAGGMFIVPLNALIQQKSDKEEKGRILATNNFLNTMGILLASFAIWLFRDQLDIQANQILFIFGLVTLAVTVYMLRVLPDFLIRFTLWLLTHTIYKIRIIGGEHIPLRGPALLVVNHMSHVDGLLVSACIQRFIRFMIYKPIYEAKQFHWLFRIMRAIPVSPGADRKEIVEALNRAKEELKNGHLVCIFAEGAISRTGNLLPFKRGFEWIVKELDVPIIPIHLDGLWGSIFSFKESRFFWKRPEKIPYPVTVSFGAPLPCTAKAEEVRLAVMELGSEAVAHRREKQDLLHLQFIRSAKSGWSRFCMADSTGTASAAGTDLTYGNALIRAWLLSRKVRVLPKTEKQVGVLLPASVGGAIANISVLLAGKVPVNINFTSGKEAMASAISQCEIKTLLTSKLFVAKANMDVLPEMVFLEELAKQITPIEKVVVALTAYLLPASLIVRIFSSKETDTNSLATVIFSSGSTGEPKGVMLSHHNVLSNIESLAQIFQITPEDKVMGVLPFFHSFGFTGTLWFPMVRRFGAVYSPNPMDANAIGEIAEKYKTTILIATPTFYSAYIRRCSVEQFSSLRYAMVGAEKLRKSIADSFYEKFHLDLLEGYGCTEMSPVVSVNIPDVSHAGMTHQGFIEGTVGHPLPGVVAKVVDPETYSLLTSGKEGLLFVKGPNLMLGYLHQPEKTAQVIQDGWYNTGDIATIDDIGFIRITDRLSRFSKIGGEMVPHIKIEEVANAILAESGQANGSCAVTAVPDEQKGERLILFFTGGDLPVHELWSSLNRSDLPKLYLPKKESIFKIEALPLLGSGKLDLKAIKKLAIEKTAS